MYNSEMGVDVKPKGINEKNAEKFVITIITTFFTLFFFEIFYNSYKL